ncbi:hypothetical protein ACFQ1S_10145 [Kibdelosporangium lantanae]|uniref:WXG100 family type VII secretion target n=1 Tax=Kibdelosporangium lantanae TaxID=1497396 RepID=A0ABW3M5B1_9PSEU
MADALATLAPPPDNQMDMAVEWGNQLGFQTVQELVTLIRKLIGDLPTIQHLLDIWNQTVVTDLVSAKTELDMAGKDVGFDWTGPAAEAYKQYVTDITKSTDQFITISAGLDQTSGGFAKGMLDIWNAIVEEYKAVNDAFLDVISIILSAQGAIAKTISNGVGGLLGGGAGGGGGGGGAAGVALKAALLALGVLGDVEEAFSKLVQAFKDFLDKVIKNNQDIHAALTGMQSSARRLVVPTPSQKEGEQKYWTPTDQNSGENRGNDKNDNNGGSNNGGDKGGDGDSDSGGSGDGGSGSGGGSGGGSGDGGSGSGGGGGGGSSGSGSGGSGGSGDGGSSSGGGSNGGGSGDSGDSGGSGSGSGDSGSGGSGSGDKGGEGKGDD